MFCQDSTVEYSIGKMATIFFRLHWVNPPRPSGAYMSHQTKTSLVQIMAWRRLHQHWSGNVFILMKLSSLAPLEVVKMTTSSAASD